MTITTATPRLTSVSIPSGRLLVSGTPHRARQPIPPAKPSGETAPGVAVALAVIETMAGRRSPAQLRSWAGEQVQLVAAYEHRRGRLRGARVASVRSQMPTASAVEVTVRLLLNQRSVACALRLDRRPDKWVCTDVQVVA